MCVRSNYNTNFAHASLDAILLQKKLQTPEEMLRISQTDLFGEMLFTIFVTNCCFSLIGRIIGIRTVCVWVLDVCCTHMYYSINIRSKRKYVCVRVNNIHYSGIFKIAFTYCPLSYCRQSPQWRTIIHVCVFTN